MILMIKTSWWLVQWKECDSLRRCRRLLWVGDYVLCHTQSFRWVHCRVVSCYVVVVWRDERRWNDTCALFLIDFWFRHRGRQRLSPRGRLLERSFARRSCREDPPRKHHLHKMDWKRLKSKRKRGLCESQSPSAPTSSVSNTNLYPFFKK